MFNNFYSLFRNNVKIAFRVFKTDKLYTTINILGMSTALAIAVMVMTYVRFELSYEQSNPKSEKIVRVTLDIYNGNTVVDQDCGTYPPVGPALKEQYSEVEKYSRVYPVNPAVIKTGDQVFREPKIYGVDPAFFSMFNYPLIYGNEQDLFLKPHEVVLTTTLAQKYFDRTDVVGESLFIPEINKDLKVVGIIEPSPDNTHLKFNMLVSYETIKTSYGESDENWMTCEPFTYVELKDPLQFSLFEEHLDTYSDRLIAEERIHDERLIAQKIADIHLYSHKGYEAEVNGDANPVFFLFGVAILIIILANVNYINLSTSKSMDRAREVGIRKVVGSSVSQLRLQFLTESFLINCFSAIIAISLIGLAIDKFAQIANLPESFAFFTDPFFWTLIVGLVILSTLLSGIFPAFVLSSFKPMLVLKGKFSRSTQGMLLRKSLVVFQFSITIYLLIQTLAATQQLDFMRSKDQGLNIERTVVLRGPQTEELRGNLEVFRNLVLESPRFESMAISNTVPGLPNNEISSTTGITVLGSNDPGNQNFYVYWINSDFISTMEMEMIAGNNFAPGKNNAETLLLNEKAAELFGFSDSQAIVGEKLDMWGDQPEVVGIVKNFHQVSARTPHIPIIFRFTDSFFEFASIRMKPGSISKQLLELENIYTSAFPDTPFEYFFLDQQFDQQYKTDQQFQYVFSLLTGFAIIIACLGLFGMASFTISQRTKEIGIRKVLGASVSQITAMLSRDFISLILIAIFISIPATYFLIEAWLGNYAFRIDLETWIFIVPAITVLLIAGITVLFKTLKVSNANPVEALKDE